MNLQRKTEHLCPMFFIHTNNRINKLQKKQICAMNHRTTLLLVVILCIWKTCQPKIWCLNLYILFYLFFISVWIAALDFATF